MLSSTAFAIAIAGLAFGPQAAEGAVASDLAQLMGPAGAQVVQDLLRSAADQNAGRLATLIGSVVLLASASSVFSEVQSAINAIWHAPPPAHGTLLHALRNKALSIAFVLGTGVLLLASLVASVVLSALANWASARVPHSSLLLGYASMALDFLLTAVLFAAIFKILPNRHLAWADVAVGAVMTAGLFGIGRSLIGWYIATTGIASTYGAAGSLMVVLLWIYYSAQVFLLGVAFTRAWVTSHAS